jgi:DNA replication initiation complex subunit (GINS family)
MLTFEAIRDLERGEREAKTLQELPDNFLDEVREYITKKESVPEKGSEDLKEIETVKGSLKRLFEIRERKIVEQAISSIKTGFPTENLTKSEAELHSFILEKLKTHRERFFADIKKPSEIKEKAKTEETKEVPEKETKEEPVKKEPLEEKQAEFQVIKELPEFVGPDMKTYRLKESQILKEGDLPKSLNELLLKKGVLKQV